MSTTLYPTQDTEVYSGDANSTFSSKTTVEVRSHGYDIRGYLKFDLTGITRPVSSAIFHFYLTGGWIYYTAYRYIDWKRVTTNNVNVNTLTWNTQPAFTDTNKATKDCYKLAADTWYTVDITDLLNDETDDELVICIMHQNESAPGSQEIEFSSIEASTNKPYLSIDEMPSPTDDYYVNASTGSDSWTGSVDYPWKTLDHAAANIPTGKTLHLTGDFINEPTPNKISPDAANVTYVWASQVTVENNN